MRSVAPAGTISSLIASLRELGEGFLALATLESRQVVLRLAWMLGLALAATVLAVTGWLAMLVCVLLALVQNHIVGWGWALAIAALLNFALAGGLVLMAIQRGRHPLFAATQRQLRQLLRAGNQHD